MSSNLAWEPTQRQSGGDLGTGLKFVLRKLYGEPVNVTLGGDAVAVLGAIIATTADEEVEKDARALLAAIEKHGSIEVRETY
jgi:hypothetical protein